MRSSIFIIAIIAVAVVIVLYRGKPLEVASGADSSPMVEEDPIPRDEVASRGWSNQSRQLIPSPEAPQSTHYPSKRDVTVVFDDGTQIPIQLRHPQVVNPPYMQEGRLLDQYEALVTAAEGGDAAAARMLYKEIKACQMYHRMINRKTRPDEGMQEVIDRLELRCEGVSDELLATRNHWLRMAAEGGDYMARQSWAFELGKTVEAFQVAEAFWLDGNASALPLMSHLAKQGISSNSVGGEPDYIRAYAYNLIYLKLDVAARTHGESWKPGPSQRLDRYIAYEDHLKWIAGFLSPQQQADAEKLAIQMISTNKDCCTGTF